MRIPFRVALMLLPVISAMAPILNAGAATRIALVGSESNRGLEYVLDSATVLLGSDANLQLLDRTEVGRVLREHEISLAGLEGAEHAVQAGQLLQVDLFAVLEGTLTNDTGTSPSLGLVAFDAKTGARYADSALLSTNASSAASATAAAVRTAVAKWQRNPKELHTVGLLLVRNADLPRQLDGLCDSVGLLLERELTASPGIAVLERRRLEQVTKERSVAPDSEQNRLLASLRMIQLDISRDGDGLRGVLALVQADGARTNAITASVPARDSAALAHLLAEGTERFLKAPPGSILGDRAAEAARFHREYLLLYQQHDYIAAVHPLDAAIALAPEQTSWQREMVVLLPLGAMQIIDPGGGNIQLPPYHPTSEDWASCFALGQRAADLLVDLAREAADQAKPGEPLPEVIKGPYRDQLYQFIGRMVGLTEADSGTTAAIAALAGKERALRMEVIDPFLAKRSVDGASFADYSLIIGRWFQTGWTQTGILLRRLPHQGWEDMMPDNELALSHWLEVARKINPPDGSGDYRPIATLLCSSSYKGNSLEEFRRSLEQDQDPIIRLYARVGAVKSGNEGVRSRPSLLEAEHQYLLYALDLLGQGEAAKPGPFRNRIWETIEADLRLISPGYPGGWQADLEACRYALAKGDLRPNMFTMATVALHDSHHLSEELEVLNGALKLMREKPEAYPYPTNTTGPKPGFVINILQERRDALVVELEGTKTNTPPSPWEQKTCLFDLATPINGLAWLYKPVVHDDQVYCLALGLQEWGLPGDTVQAIRVPLGGGAPTFLGRTNITGIDWVNRSIVMSREPRIRLNYETPTSVAVGRASCVGAGCYFAGTCSGVYIFPTNGGAVLHLGTNNGLPSDDIHALAFLDGKLYIGAGDIDRSGYIAVYETSTRNITILASSRRSEHLSPFDDQPPFCAFGLITDPIHDRLLMAVSSKIVDNGQKPNVPYITPSVGIWAYLPPTGGYKRLAPLRLLSYSPMPIGDDNWAGIAGANTLAIKDDFLVAFFSMGSDRLLSVYDSAAIKANPALPPGQEPIPIKSDFPWLVKGPFFLHGGWVYSARPFQRVALADLRKEEIPPLREDYPMKLTESLQLLEDGKHVLAADQYSLWLLELATEPAQVPVENENHNSPAGKP